ncbi:SLAM family member 5-like [Rhinoderma darwinii]|uniref:SLAM family member 5-like n=1 Tax=Rhinoderma darwinii TaxID=43563 RepID=UPI003F66FBAB
MYSYFFNAGGQTGAHPVAGLLHHSAAFYYTDLPLPVLDVTWQFLTREKTTTKVVMYHKDQFTIYNPQFDGRLELSDNGTKLRIQDLRMEDTGVYTLIMTFTNNEVDHVTYDLAVYEPIPLPIIIPEKKDTTDGCNVTLHCSVPSNTSDFFYTWKYRLQGSEYQPYNNGSTVHILLPPDHQDMEVLCIVQNPADQKNVSVNIKSCFSKDPSRLRYTGYIIPLFLIILAATIFIIWKIRRKKTEGEELEYCMAEILSVESSTNINQLDTTEECESKVMDVIQLLSMVGSRLVYFTSTADSPQFHEGTLLFSVFLLNFKDKYIIVFFIEWPGAIIIIKSAFNFNLKRNYHLS